MFSAETGIKNAIDMQFVPSSYISEKSDVFSKKEETFYRISKATLYAPLDVNRHINPQDGLNILALKK